MSDNYAVIEMGLEMMGEAIGKTITDQKRKVWHRLFDSFHGPALGKAFRYVCDYYDRFPSAKEFRELVLSFSPSKNSAPSIIRNDHDEEGKPCVYWSDEPGVPAYATKNCPEGRSFLKLMAQWSGREM